MNYIFLLFFNTFLHGQIINNTICLFSMNKKVIILILLLLIAVLVAINFDNIRSNLRTYLPYDVKIYVKEIFFGKQYIKEVKTYRLSNYNQKSLPETQFESVNLKKIELNLDTTDNIYYNKLKGSPKKLKKFFLEFIGDDLIAVSYNGKTQIIEDLKNPRAKEINTNLKESDIHSVLDVAYINDEIFIATSNYRNGTIDCTYFELLKAKFNKINLEFNKIYETDVCLKSTKGGRIHDYTHKSIRGILLTMGASEVSENKLAQVDDSPYGKILFLNLKGDLIETFSKGHRNPQGLLIENNVILATEHGPYGGDEINKISYGGNYGFPIASYGDVYNFKKISSKRENYIFEKNHKKNNFIEPIFAFVPSIGISEIIKVPKNFSKYWDNNYIVTSLNGRSIFRMKFDENFTKIQFYEKIFIGERIRDIKYSKLLNSFILALEESGSLGILSSQQ